LTEEGIINGQAVARAAVELKEEGFEPHVVIAHMGWGEALYLKTVWPRTRLLGYFEWYYRPFGSDVDFDPAKPPTLDDVCRIETRNALHLLNLQTADWGLSPTRWQREQHPAEYTGKISVIHDGVDIEKVRPDRDLTIQLRDGSELRAGDEIVTYVARNLEPYRGFPTFMYAAERILKRRPKARILVVGDDGVSYGSRRRDGKTYRQHYLEKTDLDLSRIHFLGRVPYGKYLQVLQLSGVHLYLTVPFVLSWSMLEAMAAGCVVVASRTPPVEEVIKDGKNGLLVDFFSPDELADKVDTVLDDPEQMQAMRNAARQTVVRRYALENCIKQQIQLINKLAGRAKSRNN
jgi:glycosyltransferase involved in cell wall biosynthesis